MSSRSELEQLARQTLSDEPAIALVACRRLERDHLPWLRERAVVVARRRGWSWRPIAKLLGISHQAAARRYRRSEQRLPRPVARDEWGLREEREFLGHLRDLRLADELRAWERSGVDIVPW